MVFNDTSSMQGLVQAYEDYTDLGENIVSGVTSNLKRATRNMNTANAILWSDIFNSHGGWQYDDSNQSNLPSATDTLTSGQTTYALPIDAATVRAIEVKNTGGVWNKLIPLTEEQIQAGGSLGEFMKTSGQPRYYTLVGRTVKVFPASNYTQASSFKVFFDRGSVSFTYTDTSNSPGFHNDFHYLVAVGGALEWLRVKKPDSNVTSRLENEWAQGRAALKKFYSKRFKDAYPHRITVSDGVAEFT